MPVLQGNEAALAGEELLTALQAMLG